MSQSPQQLKRLATWSLEGVWQHLAAEEEGAINAGLPAKALEDGRQGLARQLASKALQLVPLREDTGVRRLESLLCHIQRPLEGRNLLPVDAGRKALHPETPIRK